MNQPEYEILKWILSQGPGTLMLVMWGPAFIPLGMVIYFYRRDFVRILNREVEKSSVLVALVQENTAAQQRAAATAEVINTAIKRLTDMLERSETLERAMRERERREHRHD